MLTWIFITSLLSLFSIVQNCIKSQQIIVLTNQDFNVDQNKIFYNRAVPWSKREKLQEEFSNITWRLRRFPIGMNGLPRITQVQRNKWKLVGEQPFQGTFEVKKLNKKKKPESGNRSVRKNSVWSKTCTIHYFRRKFSLSLCFMSSRLLQTWNMFSTPGTESEFLHILSV